MLKDTIYNKILFYIGLILFYFGLFISKSWMFYILAFILAGFFFFKQVKSIPLASYLVSILALPYSSGLIQSKFIYRENDMVSSYGVTPFVVSIMISSLYFLLKPSLIKFKYADIFLLLLLLYSVIGFIFGNYTNSSTAIYSIVQFGIQVLFYFNSREFFTSKINLLMYIIPILISTVLFQSTTAVIQFILNRPIGIFAEEYLSNNPYGIASPESSLLFRVSGTMSHPNFLGTLLLMLMPFLLYRFISTKFNKMRYLFIYFLLILVFIGTLVTFSRVSIILLISFIIFKSYKHLKKITKLKLRYLFILFFTFIIMLFTLYPFISYRFSTISESLEPGRSLNTRVQAISESISLILQSPLFGIGINRFLEISDNSTDIHNLFFQIATAVGIPGLLIFLFFLCSIWQETRGFKKNNWIVRASYVGIFFFILESMMNPVFVKHLMRLFILYAAIIVSYRKHNEYTAGK